MIKSDYIMRLLQEFIQKLINLILNRRDTESVEIEPQVFRQGCSLLEIAEDKFLQMSAEETVNTFSAQNHALAKIELSAYLAYIRHQNEKAKSLLLHVNSHSKDFSIERQHLLNKII
jgi:hypothetical protein